MPLKAIILNMLSLSATFGGLVWIFQDGHFQNLLNFELIGSIDAAQPVLIFAIAFGLSMDYEVFVLSRIKESFDETGNNRLAVSSGIQRTGWLVTSAALLLAVVLGGFGAAKTISLQEIGIGLAIAVIMDATLIRMLLLPATMRMLGTFNWWAPAPLRWLWQHIGLSETEPTPALSPVFQVQAGRDLRTGSLWSPESPEVNIAQISPVPTLETGQISVSRPLRTGASVPTLETGSPVPTLMEGYLPSETRTSQQYSTEQGFSPVLWPVESKVQARVSDEEVHLAGMTLDEVNVQVTPRSERIKGRLSLRAFSPSELDGVYHSRTMRNNSTNHNVKEQKEVMEQKLYRMRTTLDRYAKEIAAIQTELESTCADFDQALDIHNARLQEFLYAVSTDLQASTLARDRPEATPADVTSQYSTPREGYIIPDLRSLR